MILGYVLSKRLDTRKYAPLIVSPRPYFVFTPFLNDAAVGTLEFRTALEPVRRKNSGIGYLQGWADDVNFAEKTVSIEPSAQDPNVGLAMTGERTGNQSRLDPSKPVETFNVSYDKLIIAVGCNTQTFGTKGVRENAMFLKDVGDARRIRKRILELFELAILPTTSEKVKKQLLHFAVVGGGPAGTEFAAQLSDLVHQDMHKHYPGLTNYVRITLYDVAPKLLPMFKTSLSDYAIKNYERRGVQIKTSHHVEELRRGSPDDGPHQTEQNLKGGIYTLRTKEEGEIGIGMCVWSTGNMANPFVKKALDSVRKYPSRSAEITAGECKDTDQKQWIIERDSRSGNILVDDHLKVQIKSQDQACRALMKDVYCLGDVSKLSSSPLPATAQVANQQALWLADRLNKKDSASHPFTFKNMGVMTYIGNAKAMFQTGEYKRTVTGLSAFLLWRGAYLTMALSWRNKLLIPMYWIMNRLVGRDITRF